MVTQVPETGSDPRGPGVTPAGVAAFLLAHVPLALGMRAYPAVSTLHALVVFALGLLWAVAAREERVAVWAGYVAVCDVLWRMTRASVPWEFAKYALVLVLAVTVFRSGRLRGTALAIVYMGLLLPSSVLVIGNLGPRAASNPLSFNLSGPLALALSAWYFSRLALPSSSYAAVLVAMAGPAIGLGSIVLSGLLTAPELDFAGGSNVAASGGYGPNQVSSILGLGALVSLLLLVAMRGPAWLRVAFFSLMVGFASQSALTFSRGGLYTAAGAAAVALPFLARDRGTRRRLVAGGTIAVGLALFLVLPGLEAFTGGALGARFQDMDPTGRDEIAMADLMIWTENPILGVGPGMGAAYRETLLGRTPAAHTEWTRLVAEHGVLGLSAAVCLLLLALRARARGRRPLEKALAVAFAAWGLLFMVHAGMRLAAPAFAMGLAQCRIAGSPGTPREGRE